MAVLPDSRPCLFPRYSCGVERWIAVPESRGQWSWWRGDVGCGKDSSSDAPAADSNSGIVINNAADPITNPIAKVAAEFLDAVLKGDTRTNDRDVDTPRDSADAASKTEFRPAGTRERNVQNR